MKKIIQKPTVIISVFVAAIGGLFALAGLGWVPFLQFDSAKRLIPVVMGVGFVLAGAYFAYMYANERIETEGITIKDVRLEAIDKIDTPESLGIIARDDPDPDVRAKAAKRLQVKED